MASLDRGDTRQLATPDERRQVVDYHRALGPCRQITLHYLGQVNGLSVTAMNDTYRMQDEALLMLVRGEANWDAASRMIRSAEQAFAVRQTQIEQGINAQLNQQHMAEVAQRQAVSGALMATGYAMQQNAMQQQMMDAANRPLTTNCTRMGHFVNCRTY